MASITTNTPSAARDAGSPGWLERLAHWAEGYPSWKANSSEFQRLLAMTDAELAREGLTRDAIAYHVFGARMGI
ncbi:MAG: hypothetical protein JJU40_10270 [Rhodobacteraceae bacterium]|nr:hypothetical protein [Paracoccaceae bacterium]